MQNDLGTLVNVSMLYAVMSGDSPVGLPMWDPFSKALVDAIQGRVYEVYKKWQKGEIMLGLNKGSTTGPGESEGSKRSATALGTTA